MKWIKSLWVRFWFAAQMAGHGVLANPLRSALTILGVAIGVASIVSLMGIGEGARQAVVKQFKSLGANVIVIKALDPSVEFDPEQAEGLTERVEGLQLATGGLTEGPMRWRRAVRRTCWGEQSFSGNQGSRTGGGTLFHQMACGTAPPVAVLGYNIAAGLLGGRSPVGQTFTLSGYTFSHYRRAGAERGGPGGRNR